MNMEAESMAIIDAALRAPKERLVLIQQVSYFGWKTTFLQAAAMRAIAVSHFRPEWLCLAMTLGRHLLQIFNRALYLWGRSIRFSQILLPTLQRQAHIVGLNNNLSQS
eukprot:GHVT01078944.1.p2 GENE.GHVT01078944.1~~GHVT01078944.1.p2  ORF type:complete len:108 (-),score=2.51 GHVT01078944.1:473-796(-)